MVCWLMTPSHYLNLCWFINKEVLYLSPGGSFTANVREIDNWNIFELKYTTPSDAISQHRSGSALAQVMACCLMAPIHYLNQCWFIIRGFLWCSQMNFTRSAHELVRVPIKENIKAPHHWPCMGNPPVTVGFPSQRASNAETFPFDDVIIIIRFFFKQPTHLLFWEITENVIVFWCFYQNHPDVSLPTLQTRLDSLTSW